MELRIWSVVQYLGNMYDPQIRSTASQENKGKAVNFQGCYGRRRREECSPIYSHLLFPFQKSTWEECQLAKNIHAFHSLKLTAVLFSSCRRSQSVASLPCGFLHARGREITKSYVIVSSFPSLRHLPGKSIGDFFGTWSGNLIMS